MSNRTEDTRSQTAKNERSWMRSKTFGAKPVIRTKSMVCQILCALIKIRQKQCDVAVDTRVLRKPLLPQKNCPRELCRLFFRGTINIIFGQRDTKNHLCLFFLCAIVQHIETFTFFFTSVRWEDSFQLHLFVWMKPLESGCGFPFLNLATSSSCSHSSVFSSNTTS